MILTTPKWLRDLAGAWIFYSILPSWPWPKPTFNRIARFAPIIGLVIGSLQALIWLFLAHKGWSKESLALVVISFGAWITGGIHIDGLMDTADGLAAGQTKCLEAMHDSRVGANGVKTIMILVLLQIASLTKLESFSPLALPIAAFWGRCAPLWAIANFKYLHQNETSSFHKKSWQGLHETKPALIAFLILIISVLTTPIGANIQVKLIAGIVIGLIPTLLVPHLLGLRLGGHSGDSYGATLVIVETFIYFLLAMLL